MVNYQLSPNVKNQNHEIKEVPNFCSYDHGIMAQDTFQTVNIDGIFAESQLKDYINSGGLTKQNKRSNCNQVNCEESCESIDWLSGVWGLVKNAYQKLNGKTYQHQTFKPQTVASQLRLNN